MGCAVDRKYVQKASESIYLEEIHILPGHITINFTFYDSIELSKYRLHLLLFLCVVPDSFAFITGNYQIQKELAPILLF